MGINFQISHEDESRVTKETIERFYLIEEGIEHLRRQQKLEGGGSKRKVTDGWDFLCPKAYEGCVNAKDPDIFYCRCANRLDAEEIKNARINLFLFEEAQRAFETLEYSINIE